MWSSVCRSGHRLIETSTNSISCVRPVLQFHPKMMSTAEQSIDPMQATYLSEQCILVDKHDQIIGSASKRECHRWDRIEKGECLHRAFSVFLFNAQNQLLLQQRSDKKITFPLQWTNTCCSHPLSTQVEMSGVEGVKKAAQRKLEHELGIPKTQVPTDSMHYLTRICYSAQADADWGEHEIDYILFMKHQQVDVTKNPNEVLDVAYVSKDKLTQMMADPAIKFTPWFTLIAKSFLPKWWDNIDTLDSLADHDTIHSFE